MKRPSQPDLTGNRRIALVHHNALLREGIGLILEGGGFEVVWQADDTIGLLESLDEADPDVILLDWESPGVDPPLVGKLAASPDHAPVVIVTRPDIADDLSPALEMGAAGFLSVNLSGDEFLAALRMLAQGDMLVSQEMVPAVSNNPPPDNHMLASLTPRELEILRALGQGATNQEIADLLFISPHTVKIHVRRVLAKMDFRNRQQAAAYAAGAGLVH